MAFRNTDIANQQVIGKEHINQIDIDNTFSLGMVCPALRNGGKAEFINYLG